MPVNQNGLAAGSSCAIYVAPAVADHVAGAKIDREVIGRAEEHPRPRLAAIAFFAMASASVITDLDPIKVRDGLQQSVVDFFHDRPGLGSSPDIRLISDDHKEEPGGLQLRASFRHTSADFQLRRILRRIRLPFADDRLIENAVAIEKDGPSYLMLSHLVWLTFRSG